MSISKRLRYEILRRDNHACRYCGATAPDATLHVDHVIPVTLGGSDDPTNLVAACRDCNVGKSASNPDAPLVADVAADALRWKEAMAAVRGEAIADGERNDTWRAAFLDYWRTFTVVVPTYRGGTGQPEQIELPVDWRIAVSELAADGMIADEMNDAIDVAMARNPDDRFRYFVGVVRNKIRARQDAARELLTAEAG